MTEWEMLSLGISGAGLVAVYVAMYRFKRVAARLQKLQEENRDD